MAKIETPLPSDLLEAKHKLAEWRATQPKRSPLPEHLWDAVVKLARTHGLYRTTKALGVDYGTLKRRISGESKESRSAAPAFVELITAPAAGAACVVEMMRIETSASVDWTQLLDAWRRRSA